MQEPHLLRVAQSEARMTLKQDYGMSISRHRHRLYFLALFRLFPRSSCVLLFVQLIGSPRKALHIESNGADRVSPRDQLSSPQHPHRCN